MTAFDSAWSAINELDGSQRRHLAPRSRCVQCEARMRRVNADEVECVPCKRRATEPLARETCMRILTDLLRNFRRLTPRRQRSVLRDLRELAKHDATNPVLGPD